jgi:hypothetical protein
MPTKLTVGAVGLVLASGPYTGAPSIHLPTKLTVGAVGLGLATGPLHRSTYAYTCPLSSPLVL